jgi:cytochrome b pre-mRNA-processing protein 3
MAFAFLNRFFGRDDLRDQWRPLYRHIVEQARAPHWYLDGAVADDMTGRFDMICLIASLVMIRMDALGLDGAEGAARLTEVLVEDLEGQVREIGFGDQVIGKRMGELMSAFGGRLGAYREGLAANDLKPALIRNLYRGETQKTVAVTHSESQALSLWNGLQNMDLGQLQKSELA